MYHAYTSRAIQWCNGLLTAVKMNPSRENKPSDSEYTRTLPTRSTSRLPSQVSPGDHTFIPKHRHVSRKIKVLIVVALLTALLVIRMTSVSYQSSKVSTKMSFEDDHTDIEIDPSSIISFFTNSLQCNSSAKCCISTSRGSPTPCAGYDRHLHHLQIPQHLQYFIS